MNAGFSLESGCEERGGERWLEGTLELRVGFCLFCWYLGLLIFVIDRELGFVFIHRM